MKKLLQGLLAFLIVISLVQPEMVEAAGMSTNKTSMTITAGSSATFVVTASGCAGRVDIASDKKSVATVSTSKVWLDSTGTKSATVTVKAVSVGTAHITVKNNDVSTDGGADISGKTITITVNVVAPKNYSSNNKFATFGVKNHDNELVDHGSGKYSLTVREAVDEIEIYATAEDSKATVSGTGVKKLEYGENKFDVTVTAENGSKNTRTITVIRKDGIYVEDIIEEINAGNNNFTVIKDDDHEVPSDAVTLINEQDKSIVVNEYDENGNVISYVAIDGSKLTSNDPIKLDVDMSDIPGIDKVTGYMKGICVNAAIGTIPEGVKVGIPVNGLCPDGTTVNIYRYNAETGQLELVMADVLVNNGVVELEGIDATNLFITPGTYVPPVEETPTAFHTCIWFFIALIALITNALQAFLKKKSRA